MKVPFAFSDFEIELKMQKYLQFLSETILRQVKKHKSFEKKIRLRDFFFNFCVRTCQLSQQRITEKSLDC